MQYQTPLVPVLHFCRGKGDYFRLGHGNDSHVRKPQVVEGLKDKIVVDVAVGALHCLAVTEQGQVSEIYDFFLIRRYHLPYVKFAWRRCIDRQE